MFADKELDEIKLLLTYWMRIAPVFAGRWDPRNGRWGFVNAVRLVCVQYMNSNVECVSICVCVCVSGCVGVCFLCVCDF